MKVVAVTFCLVFVAVYKGEAAIKCIQGSNGSAAATDCTDTQETKCSQPKFVEYTGMSSGTYKCGKCADNTATTCEDCDGNACNVKKETGADFKCYDYELKKDKLVMKEDATTCKRLKVTKIKCNMPGESADGTYTVQKKGCGPCTDADKTAKKCVECDTAECNKPPIKCLQGAGDGSDMTATPCATEPGKAPPTKCNQPKFIDYTGFAADQTYGCGACPDNSGAKCQDCDGNKDTACNKKIETEKDFKCYDYELKEEKLVKKKDAVTCKRLKDTKIKCNMPGKSADKTYKVQKNGCGPCEAADKKANKCAECDTAECNKASTITTFILPLVAIFYILL